MRSAGLLVQLGLSDDPGLISQEHVLHDLFSVVHEALLQSVDVYAFGNAFPDLQVLIVGVY